MLRRIVLVVAIGIGVVACAPNPSRSSEPTKPTGSTLPPLSSVPPTSNPPPATIVITTTIPPKK
jgi:hypothetical protein